MIAPELLEWRPEWQTEALCRLGRPEWWFPPRGRSPALMAATRSVCLVCPVLDDCLSFAIGEHMNIGTWGGLAPRARKALQRDGEFADERVGAAWLYDKESGEAVAVVVDDRKLPASVPEAMRGLRDAAEAVDRNTRADREELV